MKRMISCILAFILLFGTQSYVLCAEAENTDISHLQTLVALSVLDESFYSEREITKGDVIRALLTMISEEYIQKSDEECFYAAQSYGMVEDALKVNGDGACLYNEAVKMAVSILGYKNIAIIEGGYPVGFNMRARKLGILKNVYADADGTISLPSLVELLYNTATAEYNRVVSYTYEYSEAITQEGITLLSWYRDIYKLEGTIDSNSVTSLNGKSTLAKDEISINSIVYTSENDYSDYLGRSVEGFFSENDYGRKILYLTITGDEKEIEINSYDIVNIEDDLTITYYDNDSSKKKQAKISSAVRVFYNGKVHWDYTSDIFNPKDGKINLVDSDSDSKYDYAFITDCEVFIMDNYDNISENIYNKFTYNGSKKSINVKDDDDTVVKVYLNGEESTISQLSDGNVLRIAQSKGEGRNIIKIFASSTVFNGKVSAVTKQDKILINGSSYYLSDTYKMAFKSKDSMACEIKTSVEGIFYIDDRGYIVAVTTNISDVTYGYALQIAQETGLSNEYQIKLLDDRGVWQIIKISDKVILNDDTVAAEKVVDALSTGGIFIPQLICYTVNSDGLLKRLYTAQEFAGEQSGDVFTKTVETRSEYNSNLCSFSTDIYLESPIIWVIPETETYDEDDYYVTSLSYLKGTFYYTYTAYDVDEFNYSDKLVIKNTQTTINNEHDKYGQIVMIDKITSLTDDNGNKCSALYGWVDDFENYRITSKTNLFSGLKRGDVVKVHVNHNGYADKCDLLYSSGGEEGYSDSSALDSRQVVLKGFVKNTDLVRKLVKLSLPSEKVFKFSGAPYVYVYDEHDDEIIKGTLADIAEDDYVIMRLSYGTLSHAFVIK